MTTLDLDTLQSYSLSLLQSTDELGLLDAIDELRSQGLSHYVALPQLIVCGDQSLGKSSVLEAISGIPFPTKDNLCTRFATELIIRRTTTPSVSISIVPSPTSSEGERQRLTDFKETLQSLEDFPSLLDKAQKYMGISSSTSAFSNDVLRIELSGPDRPHLTIVDLPGLIHSENKQQTTEDVELILSMIQMYMANRRSIILAVVSAKNDYANQIVTKLAKDVDFKGYRTLGIITKPDTLPIGSESEAGYVNLARNQDVEFRLGWHVLRNRDYVTRDASTEDRDRIEALFFTQGIWRDIPKNMVGVASLRTRLSKVLLDQIRAELPSLSQEIDTSLEETLQILERLGPSRGTLDEQRLFLLDMSQSFQSITRAAVDGTYGDTFFGDARSTEGYSKRLRSVIQNLNLQFANTMRMKGHKRQIIDNAPPTKTGQSPFQTFQAVTPEIISRGELLDEVAELLKKSRGRELPGMFNALIVGDLFREQSSPWESLASNHLEAVLEASRTFLELTFSHLTDDVTAEVICQEVIYPLVEERSRAMTAKLEELLSHHQKGHPITYNHYLTETIQNMREKRLEAEIASRLSRAYGTTDIASLEELPAKTIKTANLIYALLRRNEADMDRYASSELLDCMQAYYKVTMKSTIDNIAILAVEKLLIGGLEDMLSPAYAMTLEPALISKIASESSDNSSQREHLLRKVAILQAGIKTCKQYAQHNTSGLRQRARILSPPPALSFEDESDTDSSTIAVDHAKNHDVVKPESVFSVPSISTFSTWSTPESAMEFPAGQPSKARKSDKRKGKVLRDPYRLSDALTASTTI